MDYFGVKRNINYVSVYNNFREQPLIRIRVRTENMFLLLILKRKSLNPRDNLLNFNKTKIIFKFIFIEVKATAATHKEPEVQEYTEKGIF